MRKQSTWARKAIANLIGAGWTPNNKGLGHSQKALMAELMNRDEFRLFLRRVNSVGKPEHAWVWFVWQGPDETTPNGEEIIADYTINLDDILEPLAAEGDALDRRS